MNISLKFFPLGDFSRNFVTVTTLHISRLYNPPAAIPCRIRSRIVATRNAGCGTELAKMRSRWPIKFRVRSAVPREPDRARLSPDVAAPPRNRSTPARSDRGSAVLTRRAGTFLHPLRGKRLHIPRARPSEGWREYSRQLLFSAFVTLINPDSIQR